MGGIIRQNAETGCWESAPTGAAERSIAQTKPAAAEHVAPAVRELAGQFSEKTGIRVEFFEGDNTRRGYEKDGVLHLNASITERAAAVRTLIHEAAHSAEGSEGYARLRSAIEGSTAFTQALEKYMGQQDATLDAAAAQKQAEYARQGVDLTLEEAKNEVVAQFCEENLFADEKGVRDLVQKDRTLARRVLDWVRSMIDTVTGARARAELRRIEGLYLDALGQEGTRDGTARYALANQQQATRYDYSKSFAEQVDDYINRAFPARDSLLVGETPEVLKNVGFNALPVTINQKHVEYALNGKQGDVRGDHLIDEAMLKQLPEAMKNPLAIITSQTQTGTSVVALLQMTNKNGDTVIAPVYIDGRARQNNIVKWLSLLVSY